MHKFWARKPHNVVSEYIQHYSKKGDIVLDPFCGSGVTAIESLKLGRKAVAIDLDPIATFITRMSMIPVNITEYEKAYQSLKEKVKPKINQLYQTKCPECGKNATIICMRWNNGTPTEIRNLVCPSCGMVRDKKLGREDKQKLRQIEEMDIPYWYPKDKFEYPNDRPFKKREKIETIPDLFTKRNLISLSILYHEIESIPNTTIRDLMKFTFSSTLAQTTKMMLWSRTSRPSWKVHSYWGPSENVELNVWDRFENRFVKIRKGKKRSQKVIDNLYKEASTFNDLLNDKTVLISTQSALNLGQDPASLPSRSIDYVFTDPPYGGSVQYFELSTLWLSWLRGENNDPRFQLDFDEEITINKYQDKGFGYYHKMLRASFQEVYRVLKKGSWLTVTFHNTSIKIYNSIIKAIVLAGFDLEKVVYQPPARRGAKQQLQPYGSAIGDYYIRFRKTEKDSAGIIAYSEIDKERYERIIVDTVKKLIAERGEPIPYSIIVNSYPVIYNELKKSGFLFSAPEDIETILKRNLSKEFVLIDVKNSKGKVIGQKWWVKGVKFLDRVPLSERVEAITMNILNREIRVSFDDVLRQIYLKFTNALTPDTQSVRQVLEEYAHKTKDGKWRLKPKIRERQNEHDLIVEKLAIIGRKAGFDVYADIEGWRSLPKLDLPDENLARIREIDVIWYDRNEITHEFEVENTTGITEAIVRGSNIPTMKTKRYIVIPEERHEFFYRKISEPILTEKVQQYNWQFMFYDSLKTFYEENRRKKRIDLSEFEEISQKPKMPKKTLETLEHFTK
jgi:DNA modification methylase